MVKDKLAEIFVEEFSMLWDYADELRLQNPGNTIKMVVNRGTPKSPPHFKRFYVCFEALKRGWKEGCRLILSLDGCFLKGPFKGEMLFAVGRDGNNQMYLVTWAIIEGECTDSGSGNRKKKYLYKIDEGVSKELFSKNSKLGLRPSKGCT
ncbi:hypothetical protein Gotri_020900 [Gossypium trilobum]|uniref:Uncharacterized protein n=1 Tax=Gossypium trilobum TaxID=34281 RepID=A0A7J9DAU5_9ROSI|nr:hypothetical protein [Gossypium trilobum]